MDSEQRELARHQELRAIVDALTAELGALRAEVQHLRTTQLRSSAPTTITSGEQTSRRGMLKTALGAAVATVGAGALLERQSGVALADGNEGQTYFTSSVAPAIYAHCSDPNGIGIQVVGDNIGIYSVMDSGSAVVGTCYSTAANATAIIGTIDSATPGDSSAAVLGQNNGTGANGIGVYGTQAGSGFGGVFGCVSGIGVYAVGGSGTGVYASGAIGVSAHGTSGRGGVFAGSAAQIQLTPASVANHPASGALGDLFLGATGRLWLCKGGTTWVELAPTTTLAIAAGWNMVGIAPGSAGLMASHVLAGLLTATGGQLAALYGLSHNQWTPSFIDHATHTIGTDFSLIAGLGYLLYSDKALPSFTLSAPVQASNVLPGMQWAATGQEVGALPPVPTLPGQS